MERHPLKSRPGHGSRAAGFTLIELMITLVVLAVVMVAIGAVMMNASHSKERTSQNLEATQTARSTLDYIARDVRSAGYGADTDYGTPQPAIAYVDSAQIIISENQVPFPDTLSAGHLGPQAYNPFASPNPRPLVGSQWTPPTKYSTGAELIRYTLDTNNDGVVDASDLNTAAGADARATPNPNDYVLVRQVYGDNTGNVPGDNGGVQERVALVLKPGGSVPPLFTVYMKGYSTPWNWANGPVPANQLQNIDRVVVQVTASSARPDNKGKYPTTSLRTEVNSMRNSPNVGVPTYSVSGYVYDDRNTNHVRDGSDTGIPNASVQLGTSMICYTNASGYFSFRAPVGTYTLRHTPAAGFGSELSPDTFTVVVNNTNLSYAFADTARSGGWVTINCYNDANGNGTRDGGETGLQSVSVTLAGTSGYTDPNGNVSLFSAPGNWSALATVPDTMAATTPNPVTGTITNGSTASGSIGMQLSANGTITGTVYADQNKNGVRDAGEAGISNVWVGVTTNGGVSVQGFAYTDNNGAFSITVPANDPPRTTPYTVYCVPPAGKFPTTSTATGGLYVQVNQTLSGYAFGVANYQVISLNANRVLSLISANLMEKDWTGNPSKAAGDADLILGADANGTDQISVWFNQYDAVTLFDPSPNTKSNSGSGFTRAAPQSVLSMAIDTLDANIAPFSRPDLVTGTKYTVGGNFFVWYTQNSSGNEGIFTSSYSTGQNYMTSDNGDVQAVKTLDVIGGNKPDIIVGTKSATANQGQIEIWTNNNAATPSFTRAETYTTFGAASTLIGEVNAIEMVDLDNDGLKDMVVTTRTGTYSGQVLYFKNMGKAASPHFQFLNVVYMGLAGTSLASSDVDGDGYQDIIVGTQYSPSGGYLVYLKNNGLWGFSTVKVVTAPGVVTALAMADMGGGGSVKDLIVGYRTSTTGYGGGVNIYYLDVMGVPDYGVDPSGGSIVNMVPAATTGNFNYGTYPSGAPTPYLQDLAVGVKSSATTGSLVIFIR